MPVSKIARNENRSNLQDRQAKEDRHTQDRQVQVAITLTKDRQAKVDSHILYKTDRSRRTLRDRTGRPMGTYRHGQAGQGGPTDLRQADF